VLYPFVVADAGGWHPLLRLSPPLLHRMRCSAQWRPQPEGIRFSGARDTTGPDHTERSALVPIAPLP